MLTVLLVEMVGRLISLVEEFDVIVWMILVPYQVKEVNLVMKRKIIYQLSVFINEYHIHLVRHGSTDFIWHAINGFMAFFEMVRHCSYVYSHTGEAH